MLWMFQRVYYGEVTHEENTTLRDLLPREWAAVVPLCVMAFVMGVFPTFFLRPMEASVDAIVQRVQQGQTLRADNKMQDARFKMQTVHRPNPPDRHCVFCFLPFEF
jgi:NADH:ubiquinone oxidoreductase subunit 4 (subunit M)